MSGSRSVARELAGLVLRPGPDDLAPRTLDCAAMLVASTVASAALGTTIGSARVVADILRDRHGGAGQATVWFGSGQRLAMVDAIRLNAVRSSAAASDDSDLRNIIHPGTPATSSAVAIAERYGRSGAELLAAVVCGWEAAARIGWAITPGYQRVGYHGSMASIFAATGAAIRLMGLDENRATHAFALAATSLFGLVRPADHSTAREHHESMAALLGTEAAVAARHGYTADEWVFERSQGYLEVVGRTTPDAGRAAILDGFGESWQIAESMAVKLVPGGHPFHTGAEAAVAAVTAGGIAAEEISSITIAAPGLTAFDGPVHPRDLVEMAHSRTYFVAAGAADGAFSWHHAGQDKIDDPRIHRLIDLIEIDPTPCASPERYRQGVTVTVGTTDGRSVTRTVFEPAGSAARGLDWERVDAKYRALVPVGGLGPESVETSLAALHGLADLPDVSPLTTTLGRPAP